MKDIKECPKCKTLIDTKDPSYIRSKIITEHEDKKKYKIICSQCGYKY